MFGAADGNGLRADDVCDRIRNAHDGVRLTVFHLDLVRGDLLERIDCQQPNRAVDGTTANVRSIWGAIPAIEDKRRVWLGRFELRSEPRSSHDACSVALMSCLAEVAQLRCWTKSESATLDEDQVGVLLIDSARALVYSNDSARGVLGEADSLHVIDGRLLAMRASDDERLERAFSSVTTSRLDADTRYLSLPRASAKLAYGVSVKALRLLPNEAGLIALYVSDPERPLALSRDAIQELLAITRGEAEIVCALAEGEDTANTARRLGITAATARVHLRNIFRKTLLRRQSDLVRVVLRTVGILPSA